MNQKRRHGLKHFLLFSFHDLFCESQLHQARGQLFADTFQEVHFFRRVAHAPDAVSEDNRSEPVFSYNQWNTYGTATSPELAAASAHELLCPLFFCSTEIEGT